MSSRAAQGFHAPNELGGWKIGAGRTMLLKLTEELPVDASLGDVWRLLRDTPRLTGLLPGVESVRPLDEQGVEAYSAKVSDRVGPFRIKLDLEVRVTESVERSLLRARIKGADSAGLNRVTGSLEIALALLAPSGTQMHFEASIEVLGKLAALGAAPLRRRTTESFAEFARNIQGQFGKEKP
jgi:carbon monoxide dehydrogenase subunit G